MTCVCSAEFCYACGEAWPCTQAQCPGDGGLRVFNLQGVVVALPEPAQPAPAAVADILACGGVHVDEATSAVDAALPLAVTPAGTTLSADEAQARILRMLTLTCPRCDGGFVMDEDFADCFSLQCSGCPCRWPHTIE